MSLGTEAGGHRHSLPAGGPHVTEGETEAQVFKGPLGGSTALLVSRDGCGRRAPLAQGLGVRAPMVGAGCHHCPVLKGLWGSPAPGSHYTHWETIKWGFSNIQAEMASLQEVTWVFSLVKLK